MASTLLNISQWISGGATKVQYAVSSSGVPYNSATLTASNSTGMTDVDGFNAATISLPQATILQVQGDDGVRGTIQFEGTELPTFDLTFSDFPKALLDSAQGTITDDLQTVYDVMIIDPADRSFNDLFLMFTRRAVSTEAGSEGNGYETLCFPLCTLSFTGVGNYATGANAGSYTFRASVNRVSQTPYREILTTVAHGTTGASGFMFWSEYIPTFDVFIQNNVLATKALTKTLAANQQLIATNSAAGVTAATLSVGISSNNATFTAQASGTITVFMYERVD